MPKLDTFDIAFINHDGTPQDTVLELLGWKLGTNNAIKARNYIRKYLRTKQEHSGINPGSELEETVTKADGTTTTQRLIYLSDEDSKNPQRVMELMGFDPLQWELISCRLRRNYWDTTIKTNTGEGHKHTNHAFMCVVTVKPRQQIVDITELNKIFNALPSPNLVIYRKPNRLGQLVEWPIVDLHLGKQSWADESGENWDLKLAEKRFKEIIQTGLERIKSYGIQTEESLILIGNDFFHFDNPEMTTSSGTQMDSDTRWQKMFNKGIELMIWFIENLRSISSVRCLYIPGNHDNALSYFLAQVLKAYFRNCDDVFIDASPTKRKYYKFGSGLLGFTHGDKERKRIFGLMQVEMPDEWASSIFREWHIGHLHKEDVEEDFGVIVRRVSSITATDAWHKEQGYVGAIRKSQIFIWDREEGKQLTIDLPIMEFE